MKKKKINRPPRLANCLLRLILLREEYLEKSGDMEEVYLVLVKESSKFNAIFWYWMQTIKAIPTFLFNSIYWGITMYKNYFKIAYRNFLRFKLYSLINIFGLALGLSVCIMIYLWVQDELSYDTFHKNADRIFRTEQRYFMEEGEEQWPITSGAYGPTLLDEYPEIINFTRLWNQRYSFKDYRNSLHQLDITITDNSTLEMFDFNLTKGNKSSALTEPETIVLTPEKAKLLFGTEDCIGKNLPLEWGGQFIDLKVTGILEPVPLNSHAQFDMLLSMSTFDGQGILDHFKWNFLYTYVLLEEGVDKRALESKFSTFMLKYRYEPSPKITIHNIDDKVQLKLKPVTDIHLDPCGEWEIGPQGNIASVYMFSSIAILILIIACINFINLSTARAKKRAKEVGMRKAIGAYTHQLWKQFLSESFLLAITALIISMLVVVLSLPYFNDISGKVITFDTIFEPFNIFILFAITTLTGLVSGIYPAFYLSSFKPVDIFRDNTSRIKRKSVFRKYLVVSQFVISTALIIGTITVQRQMSYIQNKSMGFDKENVIIIQAKNRSVRGNYNVFRDKLLLNSNIKYIASSTNTPGDNIYSDKDYTINKTGKGVGLTRMSVDFDFIPTYNIEMIAGRNFSRNFGTDTTGILIVNETAVQKYGITPKEMLNRSLDGFPVVGVAKDFHFKSLHKEVEPFVMILEPQRIGYISIRLAPGDYKTILASIENIWNEVNPGERFEFSFVDERLNQQYFAEIKTSNLFFIFSSLSIIVACLGLFGLAAFTTEERTKEIGIRKVLGATNSGIVFNLIKQFSIWVLAANILAWPLAYYIMNNWLQDFAYRTDMSIGTFVFSGIVVLTIALMTVSYQSIKAALLNPVDSIKHE